MSQFGAEYEALLASATPTPTLTESKTSSLLKAKQDKLNIFQPDPNVDVSIQPDITYEEMFGKRSGTNGSNLVDATQASFYKTGQSFGELGRDITSGLAGFMGFQDSAEYLDDINFKSDAEVNQAVGYDPTATQQKMKAVSDAYDEGDILGTAGAAIKAVPNVLADSAGDLATLMLGGEGLFAKFAAKGNTANKALKAEQLAIKKAAKADIATTKAGTGYRMQTLKDSLEARKALGAKILANEDKAKVLTTLDNLIRINKSTLGLGAAYTNQQLNERKANNNGESADVLTAAGAMAANTVLFGLEFNIIKKVGLSAAKDVVEDLTVNTARAALTGQSKNLAKAIAENTTKIAGAAGAEAAQEYAQTWTQILTEKADTAKFGSFDDVVSNKDNQKEANMGAILGAASGGSLRAAPMAVTTPIKATAKAGNKVIKKTVDYGAKKATEASYNMLSVDEREQLKAQFDAENETIAKNTATREAQIKKISTATTIDELRNLGDNRVDETINNILEKSKTAKKIVDTIDKVTGADTLEAIAKTSAYGRVLVDKLSSKDASNPATVEQVKEKVLTHLEGRLNKGEKAVLEAKLDTIKNAAIAQHNKDITLEKAGSTFTQGRDIVQKVATNAYEKAKAKGQAIVDAIPQEAVDKVVELVNDGKELTAETVDAVIEGVKDSDKSTVRALLDDLVSEKPKKSTLTALTKLNVDTLSALEKAVKSNRMASRIVKAAKAKKKEIRTQFFGDEAKKVTKSKVKEKVKSLIGEDYTKKLKGLKSILVDSINDNETIQELTQMIEDMKAEAINLKDEGKELASDGMEFLDNLQEQLKQKTAEFNKKVDEAAEKEEAKTTSETTATKPDLATISLDEFNKASIDSVEFLYSLTMDDIKALSKNPNISDAIKEAVTIEYINIQNQEAAEIKESGDSKSKNSDILFEDEFIQQAQEEGCK